MELTLKEIEIILGMFDVLNMHYRLTSEEEELEVKLRDLQEG